MDALEKQRNGWSEERRKKQSVAIKQWRPWARSTGPKSSRGKMNSARNATRHGMRGVEGKRFFSLLARHRAYLRNLRETLAFPPVSAVLKGPETHFLTPYIMYNNVPAMQSALLHRVNDTSLNLNGYFHPAGMGRVLVLNAPYELPDGMDLRGIAGVVLRRQQDPAISAMIEAMGDEEFAQLKSNTGRFTVGVFRGKVKTGPRDPDLFAPPDYIKAEMRTLCEAFQRLTGTKENTIYFPKPAGPGFHIDGMSNQPSWRLTYAFSGAQSLWHNYILDDTTPVRNQGMSGFPVIPKEKIGIEGRDYFASEGALMFLVNSPNGLFHRAPENQNDRRAVLTLDGYSPRRVDCTRTCPFPCRTV